jgi:hypothetical protein
LPASAVTAAAPATATPARNFRRSTLFDAFFFIMRSSLCAVTCAGTRKAPGNQDRYWRMPEITGK